MRTHRIALALAIATAYFSAEAKAQQQDTFALNRYRPSERGSRWFASESLDPAKGHSLWFGATFDWAHRPLTVYDSNGSAVGDVVKDQENLHLGVTYAPTPRLRFGATMPLVLGTRGDSWTLGSRTYRAGDGGGRGDLRLSADYRIIGEPDEAFRLGLALHAFLPLGNSRAYASDDAVRLFPKLVAAGDLGVFVWAVSLGTDVRTEKSSFAGRSVGSELAFSAAAGLKLAEGRLTFGPEIIGATRMAKNDFFEKRSTPAELLIGGHYAISENFMLGAAMGPGLSTGLGSPASRLLVSLDITPGSAPKPPPPPPPDTDGDGIVDSVDACVTEVGVASDDPGKNGCPAPRDSDADGVIDEVDACPTQAGVASTDPKMNGCPPKPDTDKDGVLDEADACVNEPGIHTALPETNGCPPPKDSDGDKIFDEQDACPDKAGPSNNDLKKHGCPVATLIEDKIVILERVEFDVGKATLRPESDHVLTAVLGVMKQLADVKRVRIEGHTDNKGNAARNLTLSKQRAAAVVKWLVEHGVEAKRLVSEGYGQNKPIESNATDEGRQNNRRVEFHVEEGNSSNPKAAQ